MIHQWKKALLDGVEHARCFGRGETVFNPWHYVPVLARKPGALRNGAHFRDWVLPSGLDRVWHKLRGSDDGDRQMVKILSAVLTDGLLPVDAACTEALANGVDSADVIINILARKKDLAPVRTSMTPDALRIQHEPPKIVGDLLKAEIDEKTARSSLHRWLHRHGISRLPVK